jgi:gliding motility-associated-like protein
MRNFYTATLILVLSTCLKAQVAPTATIAESSTLFCTGVPVDLYAVPANTTSSMSYTWSVFPNKGFTAIADLNTPTLNLTFTSSSAYTFSLTASNGTTVTTVSRTFFVNRSAKASFNAKFDGVGYPTQLTLTNYSGNFLKSYWKFNDKLEPDTLFNTSREYASGGSYTVTLYATGVNNCNDSSVYTFRISDSSSVVLPNVFTPNGDDANDVYRPITTGIKSLKAWVFNRNGNLVANWDQVRGSWDGHTTSGEVCSEGTYAIVVEALGFDGREYKLKGFITLAR